MIRVLRQILFWVIYGNFWIALGAALLALQSAVLSGFPGATLNYVGFVASGTWSLYSLHRLVSLQLLGSHAQPGSRWDFIRSAKLYLFVFALLGGLIAGMLLLSMPWSFSKQLVVPGFLALAYAIPVFSRRRRLRDIPWIKPFIIALVWAWITAWLPAQLSSEGEMPTLARLTGERFFFLFALCVPFDIRDMEQDRRFGTKTIPLRWGIPRAKWLALFSLLASGVLVWINTSTGVCAWPVAVGIFASLAISGVAVARVNPSRTDLYYSFWLDAMLVLQPAMALLAGVMGGFIE